MGQAIGEMLPLAVGVALSPAAVIAVIMLLSTGRGRTNGISFLLGWFLGLIVIDGALLALNRGADASDASGPAEWTGYLKIALGLLLLLVAHRQRTGRPARGEQAELPRWMSRLDSFGAATSAGAGALLSGLNPKNLVLIVGAATAIAQTDAGIGDQLVALIVFALVASVSVAVPVGIYLFMSDRADGILGRLKERMTRNNGVIIAVICVVIAAKLIGDGITTLSLF